MKVKDITEPGIYLIVGPEEELSCLPTQNFFFLYPNGDLVCEGSDLEEMHSPNCFELDVELLIKASDHPASLEEKCYRCFKKLHDGDCK